MTNTHQLVQWVNLVLMSSTHIEIVKQNPGLASHINETIKP